MKPSSDPVLVLGQRLGFDVRYAPPRPAPWHNFVVVMSHRTVFIGLLATWLFLSSRLPRTLKRIGGVIGLTAMLVEPMWYGRSGLGLIDFGFPAYGFLLFLHIVDIFFLRPDEEVLSWGFAQTTCSIFAYPKEDATSTTPRWENFKALGLCAVKYLMLNIVLYTVPSADVWSTIRPYSFAYFGYSWSVGLCILLTLGFFVESVIKIFGIIFGIEQEPMFDNPLVATNIRMFWIKWNKVIQEGLSRVFFHFKAPPPKSKAKLVVRENGNGVIKANGMPKAQKDALRRRVRNTDQLSDTEMSDISRPPSPEPVEKKKRKPPIPRQRSPFLPKALAALVTFVASGLFHEFMNHLAFSGATGETVSFFVTQAVGTIVYSWLKRTVPAVPNSVPTPLAILLTNLYMLACMPLFCAPFLRVGFFDDMKNFGIFGPVNGMIYLWGDGYGNHLPKWLPKA